MKKKIKTHKKELKIILAGFGGQGIIFMGKALSYGALVEGKNVTCIPSYGAEVRGGTAHSMVIISEDEIASPYILSPDISVVMNKPSLMRFSSKVKKGGVLIVNSSLCEDCEENIKRKDIKIVKVPALDIANEIGNPKTANIVCLGVLAGMIKTVSLKNIIRSFYELIPPHRKNLIPENEKALLKGAAYIHGESKS